MAYLPGLDPLVGAPLMPQPNRGAAWAALDSGQSLDKCSGSPAGSSLTLGGLNCDLEIRLSVQKYTRDRVFWNIQVFLSHTYTIKGS